MIGVVDIDTRLLEELTEQSQDLNSDAVRITRDALGDFTAATGPQPRRWWRRGSAPAAAAGAAGPATAHSAAASSTDIMALQTAASIENLAISVYQTAARLPFIANGNKMIAEFIAKTTTQHQAHVNAFNAAVTQAGGTAQNAPDPKYAAIVKQTRSSIKNTADVVKLALTLEDVAAQTYTKNVGQVSSTQLRKLFASVAPVEAQHRATLLAVQALLSGNMANLIAIPTDVAELPASAGSVGFPNAFYPTTNASPISEGAVK